MKAKKLGNSFLELAPLAFGGNVFGWTADETMSHKLLDQFVAEGFNFIDTADVYSIWTPAGGGISETILGNWLKKSGKRDKVLIGTKVGMEMSPGNTGLSRKHILKSIDESLKRLQTDYVDLYQSHRDDPDTTPEETLSAYAELIKAGKVRAIGASNYEAARLKEFMECSRKNNLPQYASLQPLYNLYDRQGFESELAPLCLEENVGVINYYSLAAGFLSGKYRTEKDLAGKARGHRAATYLNDRGLKILRALDSVAEKLGCAQSEAAVAWLITKPVITAPIASATSPEQLSSLIKATRLKLDADSIALLDSASQ